MMINDMIDALIKREGGYVNNPHDKGGETNFGITLAMARAHGYAGPMAILPRATAAMIYKELYWIAPRFEEVASMPKLTAELFDTGVNMGPQTATKFLQRALNVLNQGGKNYPDVIVDGQIGNMTLYSLDKFHAKRGAQGETVLLRLLDSQQAVRYMELAEKNPTQEDFMFGWVLNRVGV